MPTPGQLPVPNTGGNGTSIDSGGSGDVSNDGGGGGETISDRLSGINKPLLAVSVGGACIMLLVGGAALLYLLSGDDSYDGGADDAFSSLSSVGSLSTSSIKL
jgi:hypothetical protein